MIRYNQTDSNVFSRYDGKRVFRTTRYPKIPNYYDDLYIIASDTDFLDSLAQKYYRDSTLWWIIAQANGIKGTLKVPTGKQIRIPQRIDNIISNFKRANSV
jgi:nucleoid-associated protein YgaU